MENVKDLGFCKHKLPPYPGTILCCKLSKQSFHMMFKANTFKSFPIEFFFFRSPDSIPGPVTLPQHMTKPAIIYLNNMVCRLHSWKNYNRTHLDPAQATKTSTKSSTHFSKTNLNFLISFFFHLQLGEFYI